jgi:hypothetical protein
MNFVGQGSLKIPREAKEMIEEEKLFQLFGAMSLEQRRIWEVKKRVLREIAGDDEKLGKSIWDAISTWAHHGFLPVSLAAEFCIEAVNQEKYVSWEITHRNVSRMIADTWTELYREHRKIRRSDSIGNKLGDIAHDLSIVTAEVQADERNQ